MATGKHAKGIGEKILTSTAELSQAHLRLANIRSAWPVNK